MPDPEPTPHEPHRKTESSLLEELDHYRRRVRELERTLAARDRDQARYRNEAARLAQAFQPARIRAWCWEAESRLTQYIPLAAEVRDSWGRCASDISLTETRLLEALHPDDRERIARVWDRANTEQTPYDVEYRIVHGDGTIRHQHEIGTPEFDETGRYLGHVGTTQDITEQKLAEQALLESEERLRSLLDNSPNLICLKDLEGRYLFLNRKFEEVQGLSRSNTVGKTAYGIFPRSFADRFAAHDSDVIESQDVIIREEHGIPGADGVNRDYISCRFPLFDLAGNISAIANIDTDITAHRAAEERLRQAQKMEAVGQLTGGVAHDFNNLLAVIVGNTELLEDRLGSADKSLNAIHRAATRGAELTQRLLAFSRQQPLVPQVIHLGDLVSRMSDLLGRTLGETTEIETCVAPDLWNASADPGQVENALLNLALNARDAMPGGGKLTIECANTLLDETYAAENSEAKPGDYVMLAVSDTGGGMSPEIQAHAFEPFFTTKEVGQGSGLGLSMIYGFAKQSGGHVTIYSEKDRGTTVRLYLPRAKEAAPDERVSQAEGVPRGRGETILVIEDDPDVVTVVVGMLENLSYRVIHVPAAADARKVLADERQVDLVLSDVVLPGGTSGPEFAEELRATHPDLKVIFMSGYRPQAAMRNRFLGQDEILLSKPFQRRKLAKVLRSELDGSSSK